MLRGGERKSSEGKEGWRLDAIPCLSDFKHYYPVASHSAIHLHQLAQGLYILGCSRCPSSELSTSENGVGQGACRRILVADSVTLHLICPRHALLGA